MIDEQLARVSGRWGGLIGAGILLAAAAPHVLEATEYHSSVRQTRLEHQREQQGLQLREQARTERSVIAQERIERGCTKLLIKGEAVLIRPGMRGRDGVTGSPMAPGIVVCDHVGNTAVTDAEGFLTDFAALNQSEPIEQPEETETQNPQEMTL